MTKRALTILIAVVLVLGGATAVIASSFGGSDNSAPTHVMSNGQTMGGGSMDSSKTHSMPGGQTMSGPDMQK